MRVLRKQKNKGSNTDFNLLLITILRHLVRIHVNGRSGSLMILQQRDQDIVIKYSVVERLKIRSKKDTRR